MRAGRILAEVCSKMAVLYQKNLPFHCNYLHRTSVATGGGAWMGLKKVRKVSLIVFTSSPQNVRQKRFLRSCLGNEGNEEA